MNPYISALIFLLVLQWIAALGRFAIRIFIVKTFRADDIALLITLLIASAYDGCILAISKLSNLEPIWDIAIANIVPVLNATISSEGLYIIAAACLKIALGLLLLRILVRPWQVYVIYGVMALNIIYGLVYFFIVICQCGSPAHFAMKIIYGQCLSGTTINVTSYLHGVINAISDCLFAALPITFLWKSNMTRHTKISASLVIPLASVGCICTLVRIAYINTLEKATPTYFITARPIMLLSCAELSIGITCISLSTYKPLFNYLGWVKSYYYYDYENSTTSQVEQLPPHSDQGSINGTFDSYRSSKNHGIVHMDDLAERRYSEHDLEALHHPIPPDEMPRAY